VTETALVIGGGAAGLTAALELHARGYGVTLLDCSTGADACDFPHQPTLHLFGCETATAGLLRVLGTSGAGPPSAVANLTFASPGRSLVRLPRPCLPAPFHSLVGLAAGRLLPWRDWWRLAAFLERLWEGEPGLPLDLDSRTADAWLADIGQSAEARARLWDPLARLLLGEGLGIVSAGQFAGQLARCFVGARRDGIVRVFSGGPRELLRDPARESLRKAGVSIRASTGVRRIRFEADPVAGVRATGVELDGDEAFSADWYVLALPLGELRPLLPDGLLARYSYFEHLTRLTCSPALAVHLWLDRELSAPHLVLLEGNRYHRVLARRTGQAETGKAVVTITATGKGEWWGLTDAVLLETACQVCRQACPALADAKVLAHAIAKEPDASLTLHPGAAALRPLPRSQVPNLLLAGAWTDTGLPATLESAVRSGIRCAEAVQSGR
jgi:uncharacterized protein with NAD-binding domain and iron-sulfur cluster